MITRCIFVAALAAISFAAGTDEPPRIDKLCSARVSDLRIFQPHDMDGDARAEIVVATGGRAVWFGLAGGAFSERGETIFSRRGEPLCIRNMTDADPPKCFVLVPENERYFIDCYELNSPGAENPLYTLGPFVAPAAAGSARDAGPRILGCFDADADEVGDVIVHSGGEAPGAKPHVVSTYDGLSGELLWSIDLDACPVSCEELPAADGNGRALIVTSASPGDPRCARSPSSLPSLVCVDERGRVAWTTALANAPAHVSAVVEDFHQDLWNVIVVGRCFDPSVLPSVDAGESWELAVVDPESGVLSPRPPIGMRPVELVTFHANLGRDVGLVVRESDGRLWIMRHDFTTVKRTDRADVERILAVADLDGGTAREIACGCSGNVLRICDYRGETVSERRFSAPPDAKSFAWGYDDYRLAVAAGDEIGVYDLAPSASSFRRAPVFAMAAALAAALGFLAVFVPATKRRLARSTEESFEKLLEEMKNFGHGGTSPRVVDRLIFHLKNRRPGGDDEAAGKFERLVDSFESSVFPELERVARYARRAGARPSCWRSLEGANDRALVSLRSLAAVEPGSAESSRSIEAGREALETIDRLLAEVGVFLRKRHRTPLAEAILAVAERREEELARAGVACDIDAGDLEGIVGFVPRTVFEKVVDNLILNAAAAIARAAPPSPRIAIALRAEGAYCIASFRDNGCGLPREEWERIFAADRSAEPGKGHGLPYSRRELLAFGGRIFVESSSEGRGTEMRIVIEIVP